MENWFQRIFLMPLNTLKRFLGCSGFLFCLVSTTSFAEQNATKNTATTLPIKVDVDRRSVSIDKLDTENFEFGLQGGLISIEDFESNAWLSGHFAYHISEYFYIKANYAQAKAGQTSFERLVSAAPLLTDSERKLSYYGLNVGYNLMPGEIFLGKNLAFNSVFSIELGGGSTKFAGDNTFTVNAGVNYRVFLTDWVTWDIGMTDYIFNTQVTGASKTTHNLNFTTGFAIYF